MIRIEKDLSQIPSSLIQKGTLQKLETILDQGKYIDEDQYNNRYRMKDIKEFLLKKGHSKCAYCEQTLLDSISTIDHYRPKKKYYWLVYSWDNLLLCCPRCNSKKRDHFAILGEKARFSPEDFQDIHRLSQKYFPLENPMLIHPEQEEIQGKLTFDKAGRIQSTDERVSYTIKTCGLDRQEANLARKSILDDFIQKMNERILEFQIEKKINKKSFKESVEWLKKDFIRESQTAKKDYLAFRQWVVKNTKYFENKKTTTQNKAKNTTPDKKKE